MSNLPPAPVPDAVVVFALEDSIVEVQPLIEKLYANEQQAEGLLLSQVKALFLKLRHGITATRSDYLSVLQAAGRVPGEER